MKRILMLLLALLMLASTLLGSAQTTAQTVKIQPTYQRNINLQKNLPDNPVIPGESPITGLPIADKKFIPILVQIDNSLGAQPQWGIADADIIYELPIQGMGWTRLTAFFSDQYPGEAGPVRSARVMHADLREGWDALLVNYGKQEDSGSDLREALKNYGANAKGLAIDGIGNKYADYFKRVRYHFAPHNVTAYVANLRKLMEQQGYDFPVKPFKFSDEPRQDGQPAERITIIHKGNGDTSSSFVYDVYAKGYQRYVVNGPYTDLLKPEQPLVYANVIVIRTPLTFNRSTMSPLMSEAAQGSGAADIFIGGRYIAGAWSRANPQARTIFHDESGNEILLNRGKTWIVQTDVNTEISYSGTVDHSDYRPLGEEGATNAGKMDSENFVPEEVDATGQEILTNAPEQDEKQPLPQPEQPKQDDAAAEQTGDSFEVTDEQLPAKESQEGQVEEQPAEQAAPVTEGDFATVKTANKGPLNARKSDNANSGIAFRIPHGEQVEIIEKGDQWCKIKYKGNTAYVKTTFLAFGE